MKGHQYVDWYGYIVTNKQLRRVTRTGQPIYEPIFRPTIHQCAICSYPKAHPLHEGRNT